MPQYLYNQPAPASDKMPIKCGVCYAQKAVANFDPSVDWERCQRMTLEFSKLSICDILITILFSDLDLMNSSFIHPKPTIRKKNTHGGNQTPKICMHNKSFLFKIHSPDYFFSRFYIYIY
jgi:hypothetical protein